jgi:hypothetical protein
MFGIRGTLNAVGLYDKLDELTRDELIGLVRKLREEIERLSKMQQELQRKSPRQANPFSKNRPQADPKPPGRKTGARPI